MKGERDKKNGEEKDFEILVKFNSIYLVTTFLLNKLKSLSPCLPTPKCRQSESWCQVKVPERIFSNVIHPRYLLAVSFLDVMKWSSVSQIL